MDFQEFDSVEELLEEMDRERRKVISKCPMCGRDIAMKDFRNVLSIREYKISGLCQKCQDDVFGLD